MANRQPVKVLAIDPGTREMGIAFLEGERLLYHGVKVIAKGATPHETLQRARGAVLRLISDFRPNVLAYEKTFIGRNRNAALLNVLADEIRSIGKRQGLDVQAFAPGTVKKAICGSGHAAKEEVAKAVAARFPELKAFLDQSRKWRARFHANMFDAVAVGMCAIRIEKWSRKQQERGINRGINPGRFSRFATRPANPHKSELWQELRSLQLPRQ